MNTLDDLILANPAATDAEVADLYNAQPPVPRPSDPATTYVTYLSIGDDTARFGPAAINVAGTLRAGLKDWIDGPDLSLLDPRLPNRGALQSIHDRLAGGRGVDLSSPSVPAVLALLAAGVRDEGGDVVAAPLLSADQSLALWSIGYVLVTPVTPADVAVRRAALSREAAELALTPRLDRACNAARAADPSDLAAVRAALLAGFDAAIAGGV